MDLLCKGQAAAATPERKRVTPVRPKNILPAMVIKVVQLSPNFYFAPHRELLSLTEIHISLCLYQKWDITHTFRLVSQLDFCQILKAAFITLLRVLKVCSSAPICGFIG